MKYLLLFSSLTLLLLNSCSSTAYLATDNDLQPVYDPIWHEQVEVFSTRTASRDYQIIGSVVASADAGTNVDIPVGLLQKQAAKLGADAIVDLRLNFSVGFFSTGVKASGIAVRYH